MIFFSNTNDVPYKKNLPLWKRLTKNKDSIKIKAGKGTKVALPA
jgi:hypothetical protein